MPGGVYHNRAPPLPVKPEALDIREAMRQAAREARLPWEREAVSLTAARPAPRLHSPTGGRDQLAATNAGHPTATDIGEAHRSPPSRVLPPDGDTRAPARHCPPGQTDRTGRPSATALSHRPSRRTLRADSPTA